MSDPVNQPSHYRSHPSGIETIEITRHESFLRGNALKYILRSPYKGTELQDLQKAAVYLQWEIDRVQAEHDAPDDGLDSPGHVETLSDTEVADDDNVDNLIARVQQARSDFAAHANPTSAHTLGFSA